jgi:glycosyltransferase involved in cell wall biosynthesis
MGVIAPDRPAARTLRTKAQTRVEDAIGQLKNHRVGMLLRLAKKFVRDMPREINGVENRCVSLKSAVPSRGNVLVAYVVKPFLLKPGEAVPNDHTRNWESLEIANTFLELGYDVDVIDEYNTRFVPAKRYSFYVGHRTNFDRLARALNEDCVKILHIDTAHWLFHNTSEHQRLSALKERRPVALPTRRAMKPNMAIEHADYATILGNEFTASTYRYAGKPIYRVPISAPAVYPWPEGKNFDRVRGNFLWFGSAGFVHKGLDLVLEAFADMPDCHLTICGPIGAETAFETAYHDLLYRTPNIHVAGWVDMDGPRFAEIANDCVAVIYPSCSEGGGGSVISCMHAGLIPIVTREASVDVDDSFGVVLEDCSIAEIRNSIRELARRPAPELERMAREAWRFARANHTKERFAEEYRKAIDAIVKASECAQPHGAPAATDAGSASA